MSCFRKIFLPQARKPITGFLLTSLLLVTVLTQPIHLLVSHAHAKEHAICQSDIPHDDSKPHIHDARFSADWCEMCTFTASIAEIPLDFWVELSPASYPESKTCFWDPGILFFSFHDFTYRRGPPVLC